LPLLKREPEIWPPHLFGEPGGEPADPSVARMAASIHARPTPEPRLVLSAGSCPFTNGHTNGTSAAHNGHGGGNGHAKNGNGKGNGTLVAGHDDHWWVAYTLARQEKALARHLLHWEVPYYLPQYERRLRAGDRWRKSYLPLFTGYVFFHGDLHDRLMALRSNVIVRLIEAPQPEELATQLRSLWIVQTTGATLVPHPYLGPGDEVEIVDGPLRGYRGVVQREKGKYRLVVNISLLHKAAAIEVARDALVPASIRRLGARGTAPHPAARRTLGA
jgi:transcription antitermination factor NusG